MDPYLMPSTPHHLTNAPAAVFQAASELVQEVIEPHELDNQKLTEIHEQVVLLVFTGLLVGALLRELNKATKIPYTPMLLVFGVFIGYARESFGQLGQAIDVLDNMNPHMILLIFIPVLIFESAFNCDWYTFRKSLVNILLLAGPGVLWGAILIAFALKVILFYDDLTWVEAITLGSVLSATDPVAVVALLKELGASIRFNVLVEGESLLNDGTAMVFFMLFMGIDKGEAPSAIGVLANFIRVSIGGPLLGLVFGMALSWWTKRIVRDSTLTVITTFVAAFLCFYVAQFTFLKVSGILSIVTLGLYFSAVGKRKIYPESEHALHAVWASIQYASETLIFLLTGIVVGVKMIDKTTITVGDWGRMLVFWVLMIITRAIMVLTFYPILRRSGYGLNLKQLVVLIYGGLRGALGMCLSLFVGVDSLLPVRFRELTVFYMCGMATLTIVLNGLTAGSIVRYLEMIKIPPIKSTLLNRALQRLRKSTEAKLQELKNQPSLGYAQWNEVRRLAKTKQIGDSLEMTERNNDERQRMSFKDLSESEIRQQLRFRFTRYLISKVWEAYQDGELTEDSVKGLVESCNIANDEPHKRLRYFEFMNSYFEMETIGLYMRFKDYPIIGRFATRALIQKVYLAYELCSTLAQLMSELLETFHHRMPISSSHVEAIVQEVNANIMKAQSYLVELEATYPRIIQAVHTERATSILIRNQKRTLKKLLEDGFVDEKDYASLRLEMDYSLVEMRRTNVLLTDIKFTEVLAQSPLFSTLEVREMRALRLASREEEYPAQTVIVRRGSNFDSVLVVLNGSVKQRFSEEFMIVRNLGHVINPYDAIHNNQSACEAKARTQVRLLRIPRSSIQELLGTNQDFRRAWYRGTLMYLVHLEPCLRHIYQKFNFRQLRRYLEKVEIIFLQGNQPVQSVQHLFVCQGEIQGESQMYVRGQLITVKSSGRAKTEAVVVRFSEEEQPRQQNRMSVLDH